MLQKPPERAFFCFLLTFISESIVWLADHPLKPEPFVLVTYTSCVGALGMKESTNMSKSQQNKKGKCEIWTKVSRYEIIFGLSGVRGLNLVTTIPDPNCDAKKAEYFNWLYQYRGQNRFHPFYLLRQVKLSYAKSPYKYHVEVMLFSTVKGETAFSEDMAKNQLENLLKIKGMVRVPEFTDGHPVPHVIYLHYEIPRLRNEQFCFTASKVVIQICAALGVNLTEKRLNLSGRETDDLEIVSRLSNVTTLRDETVVYKGVEMTQDVFRTKFILDNVEAVLKSVSAQEAITA